jgi:hypothetical protein
VTRGHDELNHQRGEREVRSPSLAQPEPAHRRVIPPGRCLPAARREA